MKKIIVSEVPKEVKLNDMIGNEIVAYRSLNSEGYCILSKLTKRADGEQVYGFITLNASNSSPRFEGRNWFEAIKTASASRTIYTFNNMEEMLKAMVNKTF